MNGYDVIVIGGGLSGLAAGITAARRGRKTLLLEKNASVGGLAAGFSRKGYYFDSGMSRVMGFSVRGPLKELGLLESATANGTLLELPEPYRLARQSLSISVI